MDVDFLTLEKYAEAHSFDKMFSYLSLSYAETLTVQFSSKEGF